MRFSLPGNKRVKVRLFERVATSDNTYDIADIGLEYTDGRIDSIAVGGNFSTAKSWFSDDEESTESAQSEPTNAPAESPA